MSIIQFRPISVVTPAAHPDAADEAALSALRAVRLPLPSCEDLILAGNDLEARFRTRKRDQVATRRHGTALLLQCAAALGPEAADFLLQRTAVHVASYLAPYDARFLELAVSCWRHANPDITAEAKRMLRYMGLHSAALRGEMCRRAGVGDEAARPYADLVRAITERDARAAELKRHGRGVRPRR